MEKPKNEIRTIKVRDFDGVLKEFKYHCDREGTSMAGQVRRLIREFNGDKREKKRY